MLKCGKQIRGLRDKKKYSKSCVVRKKNSERNKKPFFRFNAFSMEDKPQRQLRVTLSYMALSANQIIF
jgi:hypothetical protein